MKKKIVYTIIYLRLVLVILVSILLLGEINRINLFSVLGFAILFVNIIICFSVGDKPIYRRISIKVCNIVYLLLSITLIISLRINPITDQWILVQTAHDIRNFDFSAFAEGGYLFRYPFQSGLVLFYYFISFVFGENNYIALQLLNVLAVLYIIRTIYNFANYAIQKNNNVNNRINIAFIFCFPIYIYSLYIYGTLIGFSLGIGSLYHLLVYKNDRRKKDAFISIILMTLSIAVKPNGKIILVAAVLYILYWMIQKELKFKETIILIMGYIIMGNINNQLITFFILEITGISLSKGMPMLGWIAMGLSEGGEAPGAYNGFVVNTFIKSGYDYKVTSQYAIQEIMSRLHYFATNIKDAVRFFSERRFINGEMQHLVRIGF